MSVSSGSSEGARSLSEAPAAKAIVRAEGTGESVGGAAASALRREEFLLRLGARPHLSACPFKQWWLQLTRDHRELFKQDCAVCIAPLCAAPSSAGPAEAGAASEMAQPAEAAADRCMQRNDENSAMATQACEAEAVVARCGHAFHRHCLVRWLSTPIQRNWAGEAIEGNASHSRRTQYTCPVCRRPLKVAELQPLAASSARQQRLQASLQSLFADYAGNGRSLSARASSSVIGHGSRSGVGSIGVLLRAYASEPHSAQLVGEVRVPTTKGLLRLNESFLRHVFGHLGRQHLAYFAVGEVPFVAPHPKKMCSLSIAEASFTAASPAREAWRPRW